MKFVENLLRVKPAEFYLKGINKLPDKWQEVIQDNGEKYYRLKFVENLMRVKTAEFYLKGINKLPDKWQEVIHNNGENTID